MIEQEQIIKRGRGRPKFNQELEDGIDSEAIKRYRQTKGAAAQKREVEQLPVLRKPSKIKRIPGYSIDNFDRLSREVSGEIFHPVETVDGTMVFQTSWLIRQRENQRRRLRRTSYEIPGNDRQGWRGNS